MAHRRHNRTCGGDKIGGTGTATPDHHDTPDTVRNPAPDTQPVTNRPDHTGLRAGRCPSRFNTTAPRAGPTRSAANKTNSRRTVAPPCGTICRTFPRPPRAPCPHTPRPSTRPRRR